MPVSGTAITVGTTATEVAAGGANKQYVYLQDGDFDGDTITYVGGDDVTESTGIKLSKTNQTVFELYEFDKLHAISSGTAGSVRVLTVE